VHGLTPASHPQFCGSRLRRRGDSKDLRGFEVPLLFPRIHVYVTFPSQKINTVSQKRISPIHAYHLYCQGSNPRALWSDQAGVGMSMYVLCNSKLTSWNNQPKSESVHRCMCTLACGCPRARGLSCDSVAVRSYVYLVFVLTLSSPPRCAWEDHNHRTAHKACLGGSKPLWLLLRGKPGRSLWIRPMSVWDSINHS
jgi:hypothetical protein